MSRLLGIGYSRPLVPFRRCKRILGKLSMLHEPNEHELLLQAVAGDGASLEQLLHINYTPLLRRITGKLPLMGNGSIEAEDVLQEAYMRVFRDIGTFQPRTDKSFRCWLNRIADHCVIDAVRFALRKKRGGDKDRLPRDTHSAKGRSPSQSAAVHEAIRAIQIAVAELPTDQRLALQLYWLEDKGLEEVAEVLRCTKDAARGLVHRAKCTLGEALGHSSQWLSE